MEIECLNKYVELLFFYNNKFNLTSFKNEKEVWEKGIKPSLLIKDFVEGDCLDIGSGGGIPAIPLAIIKRDSAWTLIEPSLKKCGFLLKVSLTLSLNVFIEPKRLEDYNTSKKFNLITCRGVKLTKKSSHIISSLLKDDGFFIIFTHKNRGEPYIKLLSDCGLSLHLFNDKVEPSYLIFVPRGTK